MENEGAEKLQQIIDKLVKEEVPTCNVSTTTTIWNDITYALNDWLQKISELEERQRQVADLQDRINQTLQQIQQDGLISIYDFETLNYIGRVWIDLINLLSTHTTATMNKDTKRLIIQNLLQLYNAQQISSELFTEIIIVQL